MSKQTDNIRFADWIADKVRVPAIPYVLGGQNEQGTDCINLIRWGLKELTGVKYERGSNAAWQKDGSWHGTLAQAKKLGYLVPGAVLYIDYGKPTGGSEGTAGKMDHAGVYVGSLYGLKNPEGKKADVVHASESRGGVYGSTLKNGWTHVMLHKGVDYLGLDAYQGDSGQGDTAPSEGEGGEVPLQEGQARVVTGKGGLRLRKVPGGPVICEMPSGSIVQVEGITNGWAQVRYVGRSGMLHKGYCSVDYLEFP